MKMSLEALRRAAKSLKRDYEAGAPLAIERVRVHGPANGPVQHADALHIVALENNFASWPRLKLAAETIGLDRASKQQRLKIALYHGQNWVVEQLLEQTPDLASGALGLQIALYDRGAVADALARDAGAATRVLGPRGPMCHLAFSRWFKARPDLVPDMMAIAEMLVAAGANVNESYPVSVGNDHRLSALYGAIGHADNMVLGEWLLDHGANPNDGESLYHATELGHHEGLRMLLKHGADPKGTNALLRAMDFHDPVAVQMLMNAGVRADEYAGDPVGGEEPWVVPALHQAARRMSDADMVSLLLEGGADPARVYQGASAYGYARVFGNRDLARAIEARSGALPLTPQEELLAAVAEDRVPEGAVIDTAKLPEAYRNIIRVILHLPGKLDHVKRLVAVGVEFDRPDPEGLTPVQVAGWEGLPEVLTYFLRLNPDLGHVNNYGGTLLGTILHGSENCPDRDRRDHIECLALALEHGMALPAQSIELAGRADVSAFLHDWADRYPGQVVQGRAG